MSTGYGLDRDEQQAVALYTRAQQAGYPSAACSLGLCYELGTGVEMDKAKGCSALPPGR